jgi:hypothetical protein
MVGYARRAPLVVLGYFVFAGMAVAQSDAEDKRIFGVLPNYRTAEASNGFAPISARQKMIIACKDSFDWPVFPTAAAYGDQMLGNMMTEGIVPSLTHQDPRYFRLGEGSGWARARYALTRIFVVRTDSGRNTFNFAEWGGNAAAVALSNAWYPDTRTVSDNVQKLLIQCATDAFSQVLKEFWPDVKRHFQKKHEDVETASTR